MFAILSWTIRYVFIFLIYYFIFSIIRLIYMDVKTMQKSEENNIDGPILKLLTSSKKLDFEVDSFYPMKEKTSIGRGKENNIFLNDKFVSTKHALITYDEDYFLEDLGSVNGTYLNGEKIEDVVKLKNGDRMSFGLSEFVFIKETG
ncbi:FHA domain-containing protein [Serpentinicella sp. ANB-PHB4]|uniref:FHA domain-containing protein n=1 Tax=Serpentinicella sp. ANB-PHB4 TaxID=3074076 RepID=UPI002856C5D0|nr:FHA domain-containing protein [Serpentinicella sp. ANB-PHB4]MDR5659728.1 FHA domain-containing protein [Serpentinicella sp. ANB-PHB4]